MTPRPFLLWVDSGADEGPGRRYFGTLEAALDAYQQMPQSFRRFAWIMNVDSRGIYMRDGQRMM